MILGCIADDFTGATDLAGTLVAAGLRTVQWLGVPITSPETPATDALNAPDAPDAVVIALKSRTAPVSDAVCASLNAAAWLRGAGCTRFFFKYCSTFDSTDKGNIGPVANALIDALGASFTIACPAFPRNGRTVYQGHLFVGDRLLSESSMAQHPLTPMTDSDLVRVLGRQTRGKVALIQHAVVRQGAAAVRQALEEHRRDGARFAVVDAVSDEDLLTLGAAAADLPLTTGASGLAMGLAHAFRAAGQVRGEAEAGRLPRIDGPAAVLAGSCSTATQRQVAHFARRYPSYRLDPLSTGDDNAVVAAALAWAGAHLGRQPFLIYATAAPEEVRAAQARLGRDAAGARIEGWLAQIARGLVARGVRRLVVAGGETSGAVMSALGVTGLRIGTEIDPGVPRTVTLGDSGGPALALVLKSGNFGSDDLFLKSVEETP